MNFPHPDLGTILAADKADVFQVKSSIVSSVVWGKLPKHQGVSITVTLPLLSIEPHVKLPRSGCAPMATIEVFSQRPWRDVATEVIAQIRSEGLMLVPSLDRRYRAQSGETVIPLLLAETLEQDDRPECENAEQTPLSCLVP
jgi:hypothetical protein